MTPASSASSSAFRIRPEVTKKKPPGSANALISSESITLMVNGTLQSEFLTIFWPMRFTYSVTTGSVMNLLLFSISMAYILPILISVSTEYQFPAPRPPISRLPTALTSSMLPGFTLIFWLPGSTTLSGSTAAASVSPPTGVVPGAGWAMGGLAGVVLDGVDSCAHSPVVSANANPASAAALQPLQSALMTSPPAGRKPSCLRRFARLLRRYSISRVGVEEATTVKWIFPLRPATEGSLAWHP